MDFIAGQSWAYQALQKDGYVDCSNGISVAKDDIDAEKAVLCFSGDAQYCEGINPLNYYEPESILNLDTGEPVPVIY